jgi:hypothetical protein
MEDLEWLVPVCCVPGAAADASCVHKQLLKVYND